MPSILVLRDVDHTLIATQRVDGQVYVGGEAFHAAAGRSLDTMPPLAGPSRSSSARRSDFSASPAAGGPRCMPEPPPSRSRHLKQEHSFREGRDRSQRRTLVDLTDASVQDQGFDRGLWPESRLAELAGLPA